MQTEAIPRSDLSQVKLGIEEIPDFIRDLQEKSGLKVRSISFRQTTLIDVVVPTSVYFWPEKEQLIELAPIQPANPTRQE